MPIKDLRLLYYIAVVVYAINIWGCGSDDTEEEPINSSPRVDAFIIPKEFSPGEIIEGVN